MGIIYWLLLLIFIIINLFIIIVIDEPIHIHKVWWIRMGFKLFLLLITTMMMIIINLMIFTNYYYYPIIIYFRREGWMFRRRRSFDLSLLQVFDLAEGWRSERSDQASSSVAQASSSVAQASSWSLLWCPSLLKSVMMAEWRNVDFNLFDLQQVFILCGLQPRRGWMQQSSSILFIRYDEFEWE
jgi:hypothetical protein